MCDSEIHFESLDQLQRERREYVKSAKRNNFQKGITKLLTELYPDQAHFIDELLQNAEDSRVKSDISSRGATHVTFSLTDEELQFQHNGEGLFTLENVVGITGLASSTSKNDPTSIGKFGVGFKAVFAYTSTPVIHSGKYDFCIRDLFIPETEGVFRPEMPSTETRFIFPFDHSKKPPEVATAEIKKGLLGLTDNTLLFLRHIRNISYNLPDGTTGQLRRIDHDSQRIEIETCHPNNDRFISHWLRYQKEVVVEDETSDDQQAIKSETKTCRIAIAFHLVKTKKNQWVISPLDESGRPAGQVSIYFPVRSEKPGLRFHLHAPFASTVARAEIREKDTLKANQTLRDLLAGLLVESLTNIRDLDLLVMDFLKVLPNSNDKLENFYEPFRDEIIAAFNTNPLLPTISGEYATAASLYRADKKITGTNDQPGLISEDDLRLLTNDHNAMWLANAPISGRIHDFIKDTEVKTWDLDRIFKFPDKEALEVWLAGKSDQWLLLFYELLNDKIDKIPKPEICNIKLVRVNTALGDIHLPAHNVYFAPKESTVPLSSDIHFAKLSTYQKEDFQQAHSKSRDTLYRLGVKPYNEEAVIKLILDKTYSKPTNPPIKEHFEDIRKFTALWKNNNSIADIFKNYYFLRSNRADEEKFLMPSNICLDNPYLETGLSEFNDIHRKDLIWEGYLENLDVIACNAEEFVRFLQAVGIFYKLEVTKLEEYNARQNSFIPTKWNYDISWNRSGTWKSKWIPWVSPNKNATDYSIRDLDKYLKTNNILASRLIWNALIAAPSDSVSAEFAINRNNKVSGDSQLVQQLKCTAWIPDKTGVFRKPSEISKEDLRGDFKYEIKSNILEAIGFGQQAVDIHKKHTAQEYYKEQGVDVDELEGFLKIKKEFGVGLEDFRKFVIKQKRKEFPSTSINISNIETRKQKLTQNLDDEPDKESIQIERSIQRDLPDVKHKAKAYLRGKYRNSSH